MSNSIKIMGYKVRNIKTGLYLRGGSDTRESSVGKIWPQKHNAIKAINLKLKSMSSSLRIDTPASRKSLSEYRENVFNYEIVELIEGGTHPVQFYLNDINFSS